MTITSVKDQNPLINMIGTQAASKADNAKNDLKFGDMMSKANSGQGKTDVDRNDPQLKKTDAPKGEALKNGKRPEVKESTPESPEQPKELTAEDAEKIEEAAKEAVSVIAGELGIEVEKVLEVMEDLGLDEISMLDTQNIGDVVLALSNETDPIALVTNEELFTEVRDLTAAVDAIVEDLAEDMDIEFSDVSGMIGQLEEASGSPSEMQMSVKADPEPDKVKEERPVTPEERITVTVKTGGEEARVETDKKGNVIQTESVTKDRSAEVERPEERPEHRGEENDHGAGQHTFAQSQTAINHQLNTETNVQTPEQPVAESFLSGESREIMDQVMNGMRANLRPQMDSLELSLHPASLGNVKINLINKGGEITAEFKVQNELVKEVIEGQLNDLRTSLRDSGVKVEAVEVSVETSAFDQNLWQGGQQDPENTGDQRQPGSRRIRRINLNAEGGIEGDDGEATEEETLTAEMMAANGNTVDYTA
ncbi:MAG: flagellar hook-length control protein FliK [Lachnospiraceae bacterium]|nr:flagellar hook-length control protein FliK [Lachnospiraceae bacterium]